MPCAYSQSWQLAILLQLPFYVFFMNTLMIGGISYQPLQFSAKPSLQNIVVLNKYLFNKQI